MAQKTIYFNHEPVEFIESPTDVLPYELCGANLKQLKGSFGNIYFQYRQAEGFWLCYTWYQVSSPQLVQPEKGWLLLDIPFSQDFFSMWNWPMQIKRQIQLPVEISHTRKRKKGMLEFLGCSLSFSKELLFPYKNYCERLAGLLENKAPGSLVCLQELLIFPTLDILRLLQDFLHFQFHRDLAGAYFKALVNSLLLKVSQQLYQWKDDESCPGEDLEKAQQVHQLIISDFERYDSVGELAARAGLAVPKLQQAFKQLYQCTVSNFSRQARLEAGYKLLKETDYPLRVICVMVGYDDPANFSVAFRNHYGYWPGFIRKNNH